MLVRAVPGVGDREHRGAVGQPHRAHEDVDPAGEPVLVGADRLGAALAVHVPPQPLPAGEVRRQIRQPAPGHDRVVEERAAEDTAVGAHRHALLIPALKWRPRLGYRPPGPPGKICCHAQCLARAPVVRDQAAGEDRDVGCAAEVGNAIQFLHLPGPPGGLALQHFAGLLGAGAGPQKVQQNGPDVGEGGAGALDPLLDHLPDPADPPGVEFLHDGGIGADLPVDVLDEVLAQHQQDGDHRGQCP